MRSLKISHSLSKIFFGLRASISCSRIFSLKYFTMGGVAVLHPQDFFKEPFSNEAIILSRHKNRPSRNPNSNPKVNRTNRRKRSPTGTGGAVQNRPPPARTTVTKVLATNLVMGQVKILKRGVDLPQTKASVPAYDVEKTENLEKDLVEKLENREKDLVDPPSQLTDRLGPDPEIVSKQIGVLGGFYAGSAFITSPPPSSLPLPGFFSKKGVFANNKNATNDLLRMLRLNLT